MQAHCSKDRRRQHGQLRLGIGNDDTDDQDDGGDGYPGEYAFEQPYPVTETVIDEHPQGNRRQDDGKDIQHHGRHRHRDFLPDVEPGQQRRQEYRQQCGHGCQGNGYGNLAFCQVADDIRCGTPRA